MTGDPVERSGEEAGDQVRDTDWRRMLAVSTATVITVVSIIVVVENVAR
jgi:hypothetical protein